MLDENSDKLWTAAKVMKDEGKWDFKDLLQQPGERLPGALVFLPMNTFMQMSCPSDRYYTAFHCLTLA